MGRSLCPHLIETHACVGHGPKTKMTNAENPPWNQLWEKSKYLFFSVSQPDKSLHEGLTV